MTEKIASIYDSEESRQDPNASLFAALRQALESGRECADQPKPTKLGVNKKASIKKPTRAHQASFHRPTY